MPTDCRLDFAGLDRPLTSRPCLRQAIQVGLALVALGVAGCRGAETRPRPADRARMNATIGRDLDAEPAGTTIGPAGLGVDLVKFDVPRGPLPAPPPSAR